LNILNEELLFKLFSFMITKALAGLGYMINKSLKLFSVIKDKECELRVGFSTQSTQSFKEFHRVNFSLCNSVISETSVFK
jgi:hypothetical protein